ncbi:MAG: TIGR00282 family metallophosphoesterase [Pseudomonadota bacterium]
MRILFLGDIVGRAGRTAVLDEVPQLRARLRLDFVVANGENAAAGFGITERIARALLEGGIDCITSGNHVWDHREIIPYMEAEPRLLRPLNFPPGTPGRGAGVFQAAGGGRVLVVNAMARLFMDPLDDPFAAVDKALAQAPLKAAVDAVVVDFHGEATSEKMAMGRFVDGRASLCVGTHSHVPTADAQVLNGGTAYQTDAGMCGDYDSIIGMDPAESLQRFTGKIRMGRLSAALGPATLCGVVVETDDATGLARHVAPLRLGGRLKETWPGRDPEGPG